MRTTRWQSWMAWNLALGALGGISSTLSGATVTPFSGDALSGENVNLSATTVTVGDKHLALAECDSLLLSTLATNHDSSHSHLGVWLIDGSYLPVENLSSDPKQPNVVLISGPVGEMTLPLTKILGWGPELLPGSDHGNDQVVVASGPLSGQVQGITDGQLQVLTPLSPEALNLQVKDISSLRLATAVQPPHGLVLSAITDPDRPPLYLKPQNGLPLNCLPTIATGDAMSHVVLRVEGGRRTYLSALPPKSVSEEGAFGVVWHWKADSDLAGGPLRLGGVRYQHGLSVHSKASLSWELAGAYSHFHALCGIADIVSPEGDCAVDIRGDGKSLWAKASIKGGDKPLPIELDLAQVKTLELRVDYGARYDIGDHFTLADAWLLKAPCPPMP
jgi:hypothetical protein